MRKSGKVRVTYIGLRGCIWNDKFRHVFLWHGKEYCWTSFRNGRIGAIYEATAGKDGKPQGMKTNAPDPVGHFKEKTDEYDKQFCTKWAAADLAAKQQRKDKNTERRMANNPRLLELVKALRPIVTGMNFSEKKSLIQYLAERLDES